MIDSYQDKHRQLTIHQSCQDGLIFCSFSKHVNIVVSYDQQGVLVLDQCFPPQREKEDALIELETHKEKLEKEKMNVKIVSEEKDMNNKEFERLLEKFDR